MSVDIEDNSKLPQKLDPNNFQLVLKTLWALHSVGFKQIGLNMNQLWENRPCFIDPDCFSSAPSFVGVLWQIL